MKLRLVALGHRMPAWVTQGYADYVRRLPREYALELVELKSGARDAGRPVAQVLEAEAVRIELACAGLRRVVCDERGQAWTTRQLAEALVRWRDAATGVAFVIGSADGLAPRMRDSADTLLALSAFTLPHGLARVLLAEQIYRAVCLAGGHPYHRD
jgi:23S rRNA (pseudouridine1915-N3)-methyltransferase